MTIIEGIIWDGETDCYVCFVSLLLSMCQKVTALLALINEE